ncbi:hypothetical protein Y1Q_0010682 [Alligator mississippiensis]|uniref:DDE Tnp4 domain-containing protein n=1 Tax=Alligator mississippiensis TaxID=8496 RepID=A0A151M6K6_ALLMI|nr:hypothetical protein Y1Q_0010682 [Alligator mississippiensis]
MLEPHIARQDTSMCRTIPPDRRVAMAIIKLASPSSLHCIMNQFGVAACMARLASCDVCHLVKEIASKKIINLANLQQVIDGFNEKGLLNCVKVLDSTHIPVLCPVGRGRAFTNRKGYAFMILQAMVDHWGWFINICIGWTTSGHDACMFRNSPLPVYEEKGHYTPSVEETVICSVSVPPVILVAAAYPIKPWFMKRYGENVTDPQKLVFNNLLSSCKMAMECAFG